MDDLRAELEEACDEHDRFTLALGGARARQERAVTRYVDRVAEALGTAELPFAVEGQRARGLALPRPGAPPLFLVVTDGAWQLLERHAHGIHAVLNRVPLAALLDAFGRSTLDVLERAVPLARPVALPAPAAVAEAVTRSRPATLEKVSRTRPCAACDAQPNEKNYARHLRDVHGLGPEDRPRKKTPAHQTCRLCSARLPAGRLDPHMTAAHGIFHVHPRGDAGEARRVAIESTRRGRAAAPARASRHGDASPALAPSSAGRDFLAEARHERRLVVRADSPLRNRQRDGRFVDAPDVERMDGDSEA